MLTMQCLGGSMRTCVSIHHSRGTFTYFDHQLVRWITDARTVPAHVLDALPSDERRRVEAHLPGEGEDTGHTP